MSIKGRGEARAVVGMKGQVDYIPRTQQPKERPAYRAPRYTKRPASRAPIRQYSKAADQAPDNECTRSKPLRVRATVQNRCVDLLATDWDRRNRRRWHTSGEVSPRQCCLCSSTLVSPRKDVGTVIAEHTGY